ncbi:hypothetical protein [Kitasatospora camelliae]|uniref:PknH-like protein n=1 Tax=Kitasatospora camelliae TaxID=3156397 RepID=A0AAU8JXN5_9ACTN
MSDGQAVNPEAGGQQAQGFPHQGPTPASPFPGQPQQSGYGFPQQGGYGYPPPQDGYGYPPLASPAEPDWYALAEEAESSSRRRKRMFMIGGGVLTLVAVAGIVGATLFLTRDKGEASADPTVAASADASPSASESVPAPTTPLEVISNSKTDKAPVNVGTLFPSPTITMGDRTYTKVTTEVDEECKDVSLANGLSESLKALGCYNVYRATYTTANGQEVTVGVITFASDSRATKAKGTPKGNINPLVKDAVTPFCQGGVKCATNKSSIGRYAFFSIAGPADGKAMADKDKNAPQAAKDLIESVYQTLLDRGRTGLAKVAG